MILSGLTINFILYEKDYGVAISRPCMVVSRGGEWPSGLYSLRQVTEVKLGRVRSDSGWVTKEA